MAEQEQKKTTSRRSKNSPPPVAAEAPPVEVSPPSEPEEQIDLTRLHQMTTKELAAIGRKYEVEGGSRMVKQELIFAILQARAKKIGLILIP